MPGVRVASPRVACSQRGGIAGGLRIGQDQLGYRLDVLVEDVAIVELKAVDKLLPIHQAQLFCYLKFSNKRLGLLINFNGLHLKNGIMRFVDDRESRRPAFFLAPSASSAVNYPVIPRHRESAC